MSRSWSRPRTHSSSRDCAIGSSSCRRGHVAETLVGDDVTEERIIGAAVRSTTHKKQQHEEEERGRSNSTALRRFILGDYAPVVILAAVMLALGAYIYSQNERYLNPFNITSVMLLVAALGFIALGQTVALLTGGIDLSVGPLAGLLVVVGSFFINDGKSAVVMLLGFILMFLTAATTGALNGSLIRFGKFTAVAATLTTYIALQGISFLLRDSPEGIISRTVTDAITFKLGPDPGRLSPAPRHDRPHGVHPPQASLGLAGASSGLGRGVRPPSRCSHHAHDRARLRRCRLCSPSSVRWSCSPSWGSAIRPRVSATH